MSGAEQALATLRDYVANSSHFGATDLPRQQAVAALKVLAAWVQADDDGRCPTCGEDGGTSCGLPSFGLLA